MSQVLVVILKLSKGGCSFYICIIRKRGQKLNYHLPCIKSFSSTRKQSCGTSSSISKVLRTI